MPKHAIPKKVMLSELTQETVELLGSNQKLSPSQRDTIALVLMANSMSIQRMKGQIRYLEAENEALRKALDEAKNPWGYPPKVPKSAADRFSLEIANIYGNGVEQTIT